MAFRAKSLVFLTLLERGECCTVSNLPGLMMVNDPGLERSTTVEPRRDCCVQPNTPPSYTHSNCGHRHSNSCNNVNEDFCIPCPLGCECVLVFVILRSKLDFWASERITAHNLIGSNQKKKKVSRVKFFHPVPRGVLCWSRNAYCAFCGLPARKLNWCESRLCPSRCRISNLSVRKGILKLSISISRHTWSDSLNAFFFSGRCEWIENEAQTHLYTEGAAGSTGVGAGQGEGFPARAADISHKPVIRYPDPDQCGARVQSRVQV